MNLLLDTHVFIWAFSQPDRLMPILREAIQDPKNKLVLSVVSAWEMQIKTQIGKLTLPLPVETFVAVQRRLNDIETLPVYERHIWQLRDLPLHHGDPFDRLLMAQAIAEDLQIVTVDSIFRKYPVEVFDQ